MHSRRTCFSMLLCLAFLAPVRGQDMDGDGIGDDDERVLGMDPAFAEPFELLCDDGVKGAGDSSVRPDLLPCRDFTKVFFAPVARGRYAWRVDFVEPFVPGDDTVFILYMDIDNNPETGRQDKAFARGVDVMFRPTDLQLIGFTAGTRPGWSSLIRGTSMFLVADLDLNQKNGRSRYRASLLSQNMLEGKLSDADTSPWLKVNASGQSDRPPRPWSAFESEGVQNWHMSRRGVRDLLRTPDNVGISPKACELRGFAADERVDEVFGGKRQGERLLLPSPVSGSFYLAWVLMNTEGRDQAHALYVRGERKGTAVCDELGRGQQFFVQEEPTNLREGDTIELRVLRHGGSFRFRNVLLLTARPQRPALAITHLQATPAFRPDGGCDARLTWITNRPVSWRVLYGATGGYGKTIDSDAPSSNHRVLATGAGGGPFHYRVLVESHHGETAQATGHAVLAGAPAAAQVRVRTATVPLSVLTTALVARPTEVFVSSGVPFPQAHLASDVNVRLDDEDGAAVPLQTRVLGRWPDGSVKWLHLVFPYRLEGAAASGLTLRYGSDVKLPDPGRALRVSEEADAVEVVTGPLRLRIPRERFVPPGEVWLDADGNGVFADGERVTADSPEAGVVLRDADGGTFTSRSPPTSVTVEEAGPLRAVVKITGRHRREDGSALFCYTVRLCAYAGAPYVRLFYTFGNDRVQTPFTTVKSLHLTTALASSDVGTCAFAPGEERALAGEADAELLQDYEDHFSQSAGGEETATGERAAGWVRLGGDQLAVTVSVRNFVELYPKAFTVSSGRLSVGLLPGLPAEQYAKDDELEDRLFYYLKGGAYKLKSGLEKRHELLYHFHTPTQAAAAEGVGALFQHAVVAMAPAQWNCATGALGRMPPRREDEFPWYERRFDKSVEATLVAHRQRFREYGMLNFGDWYGERGFNWGNMEYDTPFVLLAQGLRRGDVRLFELGEQAACHSMDVDTIHHHAASGMVGGVYCHCIGHVGGYYPSGFRPPASPRGGCNSGHMWNRGTLLYHALTGDRRAREVAVQVSDHIAGTVTRAYTIANHASRDHSWPMLACLTAYDTTHDPFHLNGARIIAGKVVEGQDPETGSWLYPAGYSKTMPQKLGGYAWCVGLLLNSLDWYRRHLPDSAESTAVRTCMLRAADWLIKSEWIERVEGFRATSCPSFDNGTRPGASTWSVGPGLVTVARMSGERTYLDYALRSYRHVLDGVDSMGKPFTQNICMTLHMLHDLRTMGITRLRDDPGAPVVEVPTRLVWTRQERVRVPVVLTSHAFSETQCLLRMATLPAGWVCEPGEREVVLKGHGQVTEIGFDLDPRGHVPDSGQCLVEVELTQADVSKRFRTTLSFVLPTRHGDAVGLVAGDEDFLGPALTKAGLGHERIASVSGDLSRYGAVFLGTQAHTLDAAGVASSYWRVWEFVKSGGFLVVSQMNDDGYRHWFLPGDLRLGEENTAAATVLGAGSALSREPNRVTDVAGALMFDHIAGCGPEWTTLVEDTEGRPAVLEAGFGAGRILVVQPSFERFYSGMEVGGCPAKDDYARFFENVLKLVRDRIQGGMK